MEQNFIDWACSFSYCNGGNADADIWLCGIEYSNGSEEYYKNLPDEIKQGSVKQIEQFDWKDSLKNKYGMNFAKLYTAINGKDVKDYKDVAQLTGDELLKLNLYPIRFNSTQHHSRWHEYGLDKITGFESRHLFNEWCSRHRFPFFAQKRKEHNPKLIICTGIDYLLDFLMFFGAENIDKTIQTGKIVPQSEKNRHDRTYYHVKVGETLLVVVPFLSGPSGLNSNYLLQQMGNEIKNLLND